jgi:hypothetical protein
MPKRIWKPEKLERIRALSGCNIGAIKISMKSANSFGKKIARANRM